MADSNTIQCSKCNTHKPRTQYANRQLQEYEQRRRNNTSTGRGQVVGPRCQICSQSESRKLTSDHIRCSNCKKTLARSKYSNKQLQDRAPKCRECTGQPPTEFECSGCYKVLGRQKYNKTQLRLKEKRLCEDCSQERQDREPNPEDAEEEEAILEELKNRAGGEDSVWGTAGMRSALPSTANSSTLSALASRADDGVWVRDDASQVSRATHLSSSSSDTTTRTGTASFVTSGTGIITWNKITPIEQRLGGPRGASHSHVTNPGFARQGAVKNSADVRANARFKRDQERDKGKQKQLDSDDEEQCEEDDDDDRDDDSDDDDPY